MDVEGLPFFLGDVPEAPAQVTLAGPEAHHAHVRRLRSGERVVVTDGCGRLALGAVASSSKAEVVVEVSEIEVVAAPEPSLTVVQAIPKGERADRTVEVLTEIGVDRIVPWSAARCVATWRGERVQKSLARWRATTRESAKQARRAWLPEVSGPADTAAVTSILGSADLAVVLHESAPGHLATLPVPARGSIAVVVGPEGGLTDEEVVAFAEVATVARMGETVLRTSTAGLAAAAALLSRTPRWS